MLPHHPKVMELGTDRVGQSGRREGGGKPILGGTINLGFVKVDGKSFCRYTRIEMGKEGLQRLSDCATILKASVSYFPAVVDHCLMVQCPWTYTESYYSTDTLYSLGLGWGS